MRRLLPTTLLLLLLLAGVPANWLLSQGRAMPPLPVAPVPGHGQNMANLDLAGLTAERAAEIIGWMGEDGVDFVRMRAPWDAIEPERDEWSWQTADRAIAAAGEQGIGVALLLDGAPAWAVKPEDAANRLAPPHDVRDFGRFAEAAARRYAGQIALYQIWDEPNIAPHWGAAWADAREYVALLREAANSIRIADAEAPIMLAALAPTGGDGTANLSDLAFLDQVYRFSGADFFDLAAGQSYGFDRSPAAEPAPDRLNFRRPELLRQVMAQHGDAATPLWITAWGWWTPPAADPAAGSPWGRLEPENLDDYVNQGLDWAAMQWPWAGPMAWAEYALTPEKTAERSGFALRTESGERTAAGTSVLAGTQQQLLLAPKTLGTGTHTLMHPAIHFSPESWRTSPAGADPAHADAELDLRFAGRAVALEVQRGWYWATLKVWIDGEPAPLLPRDAGGDAYIALHDPENSVAVIPLARDLPPGEHELRLRASAGWGQWLLRRVIVDDRPWPKPWPTMPLFALLAAGLMAAAWAWLRAVGSDEGRNSRQWLHEVWQNQTATWAKTARNWHFPLALLLLLLFYLAPGLALSLLALLPLALLLALRPDLAPALALAALPVYVRPKALGPVGLPLHELILWLAFGLWLLRGLLNPGREPLAAGREALAAGREALAAGREALAAGREALAAGREALAAGREALAAGREALAAGREPLAPTRSASLRPTLPASLFLFLLVGLFATLNAEHLGFAIYDYRTVFVTPALFYLLVTRTKTPLPLLSDALVLSALLLAALGLRQLFGGSVAYAEGVPRLSALYGSANNLALYLGRVLPLLIAVAGLGRPPRRWFYLAALVPVGVVAFLTFSKGLILISAPVGLALLAIFEPRLRRWVLGLAGLGVIALLPFLGAERFTDLFNTSGGTTFLRLQLWQSAWQMWLDHPWLGVGPDNFLYAYRSTYALPVAWEELQLSHPHNLFLDLLTRTGLFGFLAGMAALIIALARGFSTLKPRTDANAPLRLSVPASLRPLYLGLTAGLVAGLAHGLIDNSIFLPDLAILTLLVIAVIQRSTIDN